MATDLGTLISDFWLLKFRSDGCDWKREQREIFFAAGELEREREDNIDDVNEAVSFGGEGWVAQKRTTCTHNLVSSFLNAFFY